MPPPSVQIRSHRDLRVWQQSIDLAGDTYRLTKSFPRDEAYGLVGQMRRSAVSVAANIAEGRGRLTTREFLRFLGIANGSLAELECYLELALRLEYAAGADIESIRQAADRIGRMLTVLRAALRRRLPP